MNAPAAIRPPRLSPGDTIGIVAPARWQKKTETDKAAKVLSGLGFKVRRAGQMALRDGQFAGSDADRAQAIEQMFADPDVKAIICARGGYGSPRIADALDYGVVRANPKIFVGYSDVTCLLLAFRRRAGLVGFHGPMLVDLAGAADADSLDHLVATLTGGDAAAVAARMTGAARTLRPGQGDGPLIGGNLTLLANMIGTASDADTRGAILFIEDVDEYLYNIDRMLVHLKRAGRLDGLAGLIVGSFSALKDNDTPFGRTVADMVLEHTAGAACPVVADFPVGHNGPNMTLPIGVRARIEAAADGGVSFAMLDGAVA